MTPRRLATLLAAPVLAGALSACISILPKSDPDQLYSFGQDGQAPAPTAPAAPTSGTVSVLLGAVSFPRAATGDGILSVTGAESAYIAESRWVAPAAVLFREAVERSFDRSARNTRLVARGEPGRARLSLRIDVRDFAAHYPDGPGGVPTIVVSLRARLATGDGMSVNEMGFAVRKPATENRVGPIVTAFDQATTEALSGVVAWTDQTVAALPPEAQTAVAAIPAVPAAVPATR